MTLDVNCGIFFDRQFWQTITLLFADSVVDVCLQDNVPNKVDIKVTRDNIFEDSYRCIMSIKRADLLKTKYVHLPVTVIALWNVSSDSIQDRNSSFFLFMLTCVCLHLHSYSLTLTETISVTVIVCFISFCYKWLVIQPEMMIICLFSFILCYQPQLSQMCVSFDLYVLLLFL